MSRWNVFTFWLSWSCSIGKVLTLVYLIFTKTHWSSSLTIIYKNWGSNISTCICDYMCKLLLSYWFFSALTLLKKFFILLIIIFTQKYTTITNYSRTMTMSLLRSSCYFAFNTSKFLLRSLQNRFILNFLLINFLLFTKILQ